MEPSSARWYPEDDVLADQRREVDPGSALELKSMSTKNLTIPYPEDLPGALGQLADQFEKELRFLVAAKMYELGRISSGRAADLAGVSSDRDWAATTSRSSTARPWSSKRNWLPSGG